MSLDDAGAEISVGGSLSVTNGLTVTTGVLAVGGMLDVANLTNAGIIDNSGTIDVSALSNTGSIDNTAMLDLTGSLSNAGTINDTGVVNVSGSIASKSLGRIGGTGGLNVTPTGTIDNVGGTLGGNGLSVVGNSGLIQGGIVVNLVLPPPGSTIDGVTALGIVQAQGSVTILGGLFMFGPNGSGSGTLEMGDQGYPTTLDFANTGTLDNLTLHGDGTLSSDDTLVIDRNVLITVDNNGDVSPSIVFDGAGTIINDGSLLAVSVNSHFLEGDAPVALQSADFENFGVLTAIDTSTTLSFNFGPGVAQLEITATTFANHAGGIIETGESLGVGVISIAANTNFTNDGTLSTWDQTASFGGTIDIAALVQGSGTIEIDGGGNVTLETATSDTQIIDFLGAGTLTLEQPSFVPAVIEGFNTADAIVLDGVSATTVSYASGDLKFQTSSGTFDLAVTGSHTLSDFLANFTGSSTDVTLEPGVVPCLATGSRLATDRGLVRVERIQVGDVVITASGGKQTIQWIGHRQVDCRDHTDPKRVWPIRIAPHAFGQGLPTRPLLLSPDHAVFVDNVLVPIKRLMNGSTIVQRKVAKVTYYHIELPQHDLLLAEGLPVESYLETGGRSAFANGGGVVQLHPDFAPDPDRIALQWESCGYAPLRIEGKEFDRVVAHVRSRAILLGQACTRKTRRRSGSRGRKETDLRRLLNPTWYFANNPDVAAAGVDAAVHYVNWGNQEGRLPCNEVDLVGALGLVADPSPSSSRWPMSSTRVSIRWHISAISGGVSGLDPIHISTRAGIWIPMTCPPT